MRRRPLKRDNPTTYLPSPFFLNPPPPHIWTYLDCNQANNLSLSFSPPTWNFIIEGRRSRRRDVCPPLSSEERKRERVVAFRKLFCGQVEEKIKLVRFLFFSLVCLFSCFCSTLFRSFLMSQYGNNRLMRENREFGNI